MLRIRGQALLTYLRNLVLQQRLEIITSFEIAGPIKTRLTSDPDDRISEDDLDIL
jgi:hypothetical protein